MTERLRQFLQHKLAQNVLALYAVHFAKYLLPLLTVPYLARVLGTETWGLLAMAQSYALYVGALVEYGFGLAATREVARHRNDRAQLAELMSGVMGAEVLLILIALLVTFPVQLWVPTFQQHPELLWLGLFWSMTQAITPLWYFAGLERLQIPASLDISAKILYTIGVLLLVHSPQDAWKVLALQGTTSVLAMGLVFNLVYREIPFQVPNGSRVWQALKTGWTMFLFLSTSSLYTTANTFILGIFVAPTLVGYYAGAEKVSKTFLGLLDPITQALYPRLSHLAHHSKDKAARIARVGLLVMGASGVGMGLAIFVLAPLLVQLLLGQEFASAVPVVRILTLLVPMIAVSNFLGIQWMLPLGMDRSFNFIIMGASCCNLLLAVVLAPHYAHLGMACAAVASELFVTVSMYGLLWSKGLSPFNYIEQAKEDAV